MTTEKYRQQSRSGQYRKGQECRKQNRSRMFKRLANRERERLTLRFEDGVTAALIDRRNLFVRSASFVSTGHVGGATSVEVGTSSSGQLCPRDGLAGNAGQTAPYRSVPSLAGTASFGQGVIGEAAEDGPPYSVAGGAGSGGILGSSTGVVTWCGGRGVIDWGGRFAVGSLGRFGGLIHFVFVNCAAKISPAICKAIIKRLRSLAEFGLPRKSYSANLNRRYSAAHQPLRCDCLSTHNPVLLHFISFHFRYYVHKQQKAGADDGL